MPQNLTSLADLGDLPFDEVIDVRSPSEFAEDHVPGAINLPVLSDAERAKVGTIYVQEDRFLARKIGAALVSRNAANHLEGPLADRAGDWRPLVYCWRGGQRSQSFAGILAQIGWRSDVIDGGYKSYRRLVSRMLTETPVASPVIVIDGGTGTAKTRLLHHLAGQGAQIIDLEGLAEHRGSLFGGLEHPQPAQKMFESRLAAEILKLDPARPVYVEAESSRIGKIIIPAMLWKAMLAAPRLQITAPIAARAAHLIGSYPDMIARSEKLDAVLGKLVRYHGHAQVSVWRDLAAAGDFTRLAAELVALHYDPRYAHREGALDRALPLPDLTDATLAATAARIIAMPDLAGS